MTALMSVRERECLAGVKIFTESIITHQPWLKDPNVLRKRWSEEEYHLVDHGFGKSLCFAILWDDGIVVPHPPITRGLELTKKALIAAGHKGKKAWSELTL